MSRFLWFTVYIHFQGFYGEVLRSLILVALLHGTSAVGLSQTLPRGTRNGITELSQRAPPIFGWAAIMLGVGPHSSFVLVHLCICAFVVLDLVSSVLCQEIG